MIFKSFHRMESVKGYVYILTNPSFREDWVKIGKSSRLVDVRSKELDNYAIGSVTFVLSLVVFFVWKIRRDRKIKI